MKDIAIEITGSEQWDEEWALQSLLREGEIVINSNDLITLTKHLAYLIDRAKNNYGYNPFLPVLESIYDDLKLIQLGARP